MTHHSRDLTLAARDLFADVAVEIHSRRTRAALMIMAIALSTGSLIGAFGLSSTASHQIDSDLAAAMLNQVVVSGNPGVTDGDGIVFGPGAVARAENLDGVTSAGLRLDLTGVVEGAVSRLGSGPATSVELVGASSGYMRALGVATAQSWILDTSFPAAFVGPDIAGQLGIPTSAGLQGYPITIDGAEYTVMGVIGSAAEELSSTVIVPFDIALEEAGSDRDAIMLVKTAPGAGAMIAMVIRSAIKPSAPESLRSSQVIDSGDLRMGVSTQFGRLIAAIGAILLALTVLLVANAMAVSVGTRTREIGLRRAIGASRLSVAGLFLAEGAVVGLLGGLGGGVIASWAVVVIAAASGWSGAVDPIWIVAGGALGACAGLISAAYPALRASAIQPAAAVRAD